MRSISKITDEQASTTDDTVTMVDKGGSISERNASQAGSVSAAAQQQTTTIEVTESIESLSSQATDLLELLDQFDVTTGQEYTETDVHSLEDTTGNGMKVTDE